MQNTKREIEPELAEQNLYKTPKKLETKSAAQHLIDECQMTFWKIRLQT